MSENEWGREEGFRRDENENRDEVLSADLVREDNDEAGLRPRRLDEFVGQPVEQGRVGRSVTACTKIIHGTHESFPKELAPDVVGGNTWHDGVLAIYQPTGKIKPVALGTVFDAG